MKKGSFSQAKAWDLLLIQKPKRSQALKYEAQGSSSISRKKNARNSLGTALRVGDPQESQG